jgi:hypothetical protein
MERDPQPVDKHPLIGVWSVEISLEGRPRREFATSVFHPDGSMSLGTSGYTAHGVWNATGARAARIRAMAPLGPDEGRPGWQILEADCEVSQDGGSVSLRGAYTRPTPSGVPNRIPISGPGKRLVLGGSAS